jgi:outer membrane protein assembly factor BamB
VAGLKEAWQVSSSLEVAPNSSPTVYDGAVYIGSGKSGTTLDAFSASTGTLLWRGGGALNGGGVFLSSPAVAGGVAYIASTDGNFYAYSAKASSTNCTGTPPNKTCKPLWTAPIGGNGTAGQSSPVVSGGVVYVSAGSELYAFSASGSSTYCSGSPKVCKPEWTASTIDGLSTPAVYNGVVYVVGLGGGLNAFNASTGALLWTSPVLTGGDNYPQSPAVAGGVVYVGLGNDLYAFSTKMGSQCSGSPVTCAPKWSASTDTIGGGAGAAAMPAVANGFVYVQSSDSDFYAFSASTGSLLWSAPGDGFDSSPAVADGVVYSSANGSLYAFSAAGTTNCTGTSPNKTCSPLWTGPSAGSSGYPSPAVADGVVYNSQFNGPPLTAFKLP